MFISVLFFAFSYSMNEMKCLFNDAYFYFVFYLFLNGDKGGEK